MERNRNENGNYAQYDLSLDNEKLQIEMAYLKEKNQLLEDRLADLTQMIELTCNY